MRTAGIGYASYFFTLQRIRKKLPVAASVDIENLKIGIDI